MLSFEHSFHPTNKIKCHRWHNQALSIWSFHNNFSDILLIFAIVSFISFSFISDVIFMISLTLCLPFCITAICFYCSCIVYIFSPGEGRRRSKREWIWTIATKLDWPKCSGLCWHWGLQNPGLRATSVQQTYWEATGSYIPLFSYLLSQGIIETTSKIRAMNVTRCFTCIISFNP